MGIPVIVTGDDVSLSVTLKKDNSTFTINPAATVEASLVSQDHNTVVLAPVTVSNSATGADWANSLVVIEFTSTETNSITTYGELILEIQVDDSGKTTFFAEISVEIGTIA